MARIAGLVATFVPSMPDAADEPDLRPRPLARAAPFVLVTPLPAQVH